VSHSSDALCFVSWCIRLHFDSAHHFQSVQASKFANSSTYAPYLPTAGRLQQFTYRLAIKDLSAAAAAESCCAEQCTGITQRSSDAAAATAAFVVAIGNGINACINELPVLTN